MKHRRARFFALILQPLALPSIAVALQGSLAASLVLERSALGDAPDAKSVAQRKAKDGQRLAESGQHAAALSRFKEAYEAQPEPGYLYNMGLSYEALGRDLEALDAFERFLRDVQNIPPEFVADANRHQRELRQKIGELEIRSTQPGARIDVDDIEAGTTPLKAPIRLKSGPHRVSVSKAGFETFTMTLDIAGADTVHATATMRALSASPPAIASSAPVAASTPPSDRDTASSSQTGPHRPPAFSVYAAAGAGFWVRGIPGNPEPTLALSTGVDARIVSLSESVELRLGIRGGISFVSEERADELFTSLLANPRLSISVVPERLVLFAETGAGVLVISGLARGSALLRPETNDVNGALATFQVRPGIGVSLAASHWLSFYAAAGVAWSPAPSPLFVSPSTTQVDTAVGIAAGID